jgi:hypothetical protein
MDDSTGREENGVQGLNLGGSSPSFTSKLLAFIEPDRIHEPGGREVRIDAMNSMV